MTDYKNPSQEPSTGIFLVHPAWLQKERALVLPHWQNSAKHISKREQ